MSDNNHKIVTIIICLLTSCGITEATPNIAKPGCKSSCGNVSIPYPFGIGPNCYHNPWFDVICLDNKFVLATLNATYGYPYDTDNYEYLVGRRINWFNERTLIVESDCTGFCADTGNPTTYNGTIYATDLRRSPFMYSSNQNVLLVIGCGGDVVLRNRQNKTLAGCAQVCRNADEQLTMNHCYGLGCCQTPLPISIDYFWLDIFINSPVDSVNGYCERWTQAMLVDKSWISDQVIDALPFQSQGPVPTVLEWTMDDLHVDSLGYANSTCTHKKPSVDAVGGYDCRCKAEYYEGNPYLPYGCQVVAECESCVQNCRPLENNTYGCGKDNNEEDILKQKAGLILGLGVGISMILLLALFGALWTHKVMKRKRDTQLKAQYFKRNGGIVLKHRLSSDDKDTEKPRIFSSSELENATDKYNINRILGHGGQGTVYKGMLCDGKIVAIKKLKLVDDNQLHDFINEVMLLSQINHRNIVKLLGCCLETEVPLLVCEYVPNGTLSEHICSSSEDILFTWEMRLQIALDIANALAYLHSSSLLPIFHRDIKASNILLDSKYRAKLSDFGISKSVAIDQTHVTTRVIGTFGYLDPEYFRSCQFTDKSDVYSFGVVLVELLTGQMAIRSTEDDRGIVPWFLDHVEKSLLNDILDLQVLREAERNEIVTISDLARRCLVLDGRKRPSMKEVEGTIQTIRSSQKGLPNNEPLMTIIDDEDIQVSRKYDTRFRRLNPSGTN
ncbi:hypothetical protein RND81_06G165300 [Saponaria officinalis]|uniref:Protein kinase domain-containing protein n=3 Tax=Saponaria officinalis TaxID=3572 RepID=A0AAW1KCK8_SAPOF